MTEYIKREDVHLALDSHYFTGELSLKETIDSVPSADVREIKRGRWSFDNIIFTDADGVSRRAMWGYKCSECSGVCIGESNYCPNCGTDMREEEGK